MQTDIYIYCTQYLAQSFLECEIYIYMYTYMFQIKCIEKTKTHLLFNNFLPFSAYDKM